MARVAIVAIEIHSERLFLPGGDVWDWTKEVTAEVKGAAKRLAPPGRSMRRPTTRYTSTGRLRRSIRSSSNTNGPHGVLGYITVDAPYAHFVLGGTAFQGHRYIYSTVGFMHKPLVDLYAARKHPPSLPHTWFMVLRPSGAYRLRVHGQKANPFLTDGYNEVARIHGALKPIRSNVFRA